MTNGEDKGEKKGEEEKKEVVCKVEFAKDRSSVSIFLSLKTPGDASHGVYVLERLKSDLLGMIRNNETRAQQNRDVLQAKDPMGTNARKDPNFFKKHFMH